MAKKVTNFRRKIQIAKKPSYKASSKQVKFLAAYEVCGMIGQAAKAAGCDRKSHSWWLSNDPDYPDKFKLAQESANEVLEREARRRAVEGLDRMKFYKGQAIIDPRTGQPYIEREYSDRMLEIALKAHMPDKYTERIKTENTEVPPDHFDPFNVDLAEQLDMRLKAEEQARITASGGDGDE